MYILRKEAQCAAAEGSTNNKQICRVIIYIRTRGMTIICIIAAERESCFMFCVGRVAAGAMSIEGKEFRRTPHIVFSVTEYMCNIYMRHIQGVPEINVNPPRGDRLVHD